MADEKKIKNEELTDEQANAAAGGFGETRVACQGGCGQSFFGALPYLIDGKPCCASCYEKYQLSLNNDRPIIHESTTPSYKTPIF